MTKHGKRPKHSKRRQSPFKTAQEYKVEEETRAPRDLSRATPLPLKEPEED